MLLWSVFHWESTEFASVNVPIISLHYSKWSCGCCSQNKNPLLKNFTQDNQPFCDGNWLQIEQNHQLKCSVYGCHSNATRSPVLTLLATLRCRTFPFNVRFTIMAACLRLWTPAGLQAHTPKRVGTKTPKLVPPFGSGCIPPALTTLLLSDVAGVMGSDNGLPARLFNQSY